jgi:indolepyruvate ferredoxin oxidoreductase
MERALIVEYRAMIDALLPALSADTLPVAVELASLPEHIRGFGHVKEKAVANFRKEKERLLGATAQQHAA